MCDDFNYFGVNFTNLRVLRVVRAFGLIYASFGEIDVKYVKCVFICCFYVNEVFN